MKLQGRVAIKRSIREVFEFVSEPANLPLWSPGIAGAQRTSPGPIGLGVTFEVLPEGKAHKECWEVIEHEPPRAFAYRRLDWGAFIQFRYTLRNIAGCTDLGLEVYGAVATCPQPSPFPEESARQLETNLGRLREVLENEIREARTMDGTATDGARGFGALGGDLQFPGTRGGRAGRAGERSVTTVPLVDSRQRGSPRAREPG